jgi:flagellar basal-body rod protein FlgB
MFDQWTSRMDFLSTSLQLRARRQELIASNIANVDTPGYVARDFNFASALREATAAARPQGANAGAAAGGVRLGYSVQTQPSMDGNSVDLDQQRANFTDNAIRYESTLRFINGHVKTMLSAIQGQ